MELSIATDFETSVGDPSEVLRPVAEAGFSHVHWCHHWDDDFLYGSAELAQIAKWCQDLDLSVLDIHASYGREKRYASSIEYQRLAGVDLVKNRIEMAACLESETIILHLPCPSKDDDQDDWLSPVRRSFDEKLPFAQQHGVRVALENLGRVNIDSRIRTMFSLYGSEVMGLCYDSGHGNMNNAHGLDLLEELKDRLIAVHLHDNDGTADQHKPLFTGTVDWERLAGILAESSYDRCLSMELSMGLSGYEDVKEFLKEAYRSGTALSEMVSAHCEGR